MDNGYLLVILLVALVCPLSMWLMMRRHRRHGSERPNRLDSAEHRSGR